MEAKIEALLAQAEKEQEEVARMRAQRSETGGSESSEKKDEQ